VQGYLTLALPARAVSHRYLQRILAIGAPILSNGQMHASTGSAQAILVLGPDAALRVRQGALDIQHGSHSERQTIRVDIDADPKPCAILFDAHGEFLTGEAMRWCARYGIALILPDGPGRMLTVLQSALETDAYALNRIPDIDPAVIRAQCAADAVGIAREIVRAKIGAGLRLTIADTALTREATEQWEWKLRAARTVGEIMIVEAKAAAAYWRTFKDMGLREQKGGNLPRSWLRFANRNKGAQFLGPKHAAHPINAMLNYAYVVEAGRLAKALAARGLALPIGFLHSDRKGRNSLVWDAIEPLRPAIDARVFAYVEQREFARSDFPQTGRNTFRLSREIIQSMLDQVSLSPDDIGDAADFMLQAIERHSGGEYRLFKADLRKRRRAGAVAAVGLFS
jgi:CRISP-associated protein Cas1